MKQATAECPTGTRVVGGGYLMGLPGPGFTTLANFPITDDAWIVLIIEDVPSSTWSFTVYAICASQ